MAERKGAEASFSYICGSFAQILRPPLPSGQLGSTLTHIKTRSAASPIPHPGMTAVSLHISVGKHYARDNGEDSPQRAQRKSGGTQRKKIALQAVDQPLDPLAHVGDVEVQEVSQPEAPEFQVTQHLGRVDRGQVLDSLDFHHHFPGHQDVQPVAGIDAFALILDRENDLSLDFEAMLLQLENEAGLMRIFQQPRTKRGVHLHRRTEDGLTDCVFVHPRSSAFLRASSAPSAVDLLQETAPPTPP